MLDSKWKDCHRSRLVIRRSFYPLLSIWRFAKRVRKKNLVVLVYTRRYAAPRTNFTVNVMLQPLHELAMRPIAWLLSLYSTSCFSFYLLHVTETLQILFSKRSRHPVFIVTPGLELSWLSFFETEFIFR